MITKMSLKIIWEQFFFSRTFPLVFFVGTRQQREKEKERERKRERKREREREHFFSPLVSLSFSQNFSCVFNFFFVF